jgi:polyphenol oxidase
MKKYKEEEIELYKFGKLTKFPQVEHFVSMRTGGVSESPYNSLNLALHVRDDKKAVLANRRRIAKVLKRKPSAFVYLKQTHGEKIKIIRGKDCGKGAKEYSDGIYGVDAIITKAANIFLIVQVADCVPILLFDPKGEVIAAVHAGWQGTMKEIVKRTVEKMAMEFDCDPKELIAGIGPSIGPCCFEVKEDVFYLANIIYSAREDVVIQRGNKTFIDLWQANKLQLLRAGLPESNIEVSRVCTSCNTDKYFSVRKEGQTGRFEAGILITKLKDQNAK